MTVLGPYLHVGIVVPDLETAKAHLSALLGLGWGPEIEVAGAPVRDGDGNDGLVRMHVCHSTEPPHIELIEEQPGTIWVRNEHSNLHHLGVWSDALSANAADLSRLNCPLQLAGRDGGDAPVQWSYHRDELGIYVELLDVAMRPMMEQTLFKAPRG
jgi:hypothetical protein